jgi:hypothetical protein
MNKGYSDRKESKVNLLNNSVTHDQLQEKSKTANDNNVQVDGNKNVMDEIMKNLDNMKSTETDMLFQYMANPDKLVEKDNIQFFDKAQSYSGTQTTFIPSTKPTKQIEPDNHKHATDTYDYPRNASGGGDSQNNTYDYNQVPKGGSYGPSYGDGQSYAADESGMADPYYGFGSEDELNIAKLNMLRQLGELTQHKVKLSQNYSMKSDYKAMKYEFELHKSIRDKHNGTKWLSNLMLNMCWGVELANDNFNPFEFKLKGWSEQMNDDIDEYYDVLGELYEKYFKSGKPIPPELKLIMMVGGGAVKFHIAHTALGKIPTLSEALQKNPALAKKLNEQSISEKVKEKYNKQRDVFDKKQETQHDVAKKQAEDLVMLKQKELEFAQMQQDAQSKETQEIMQQQMMQQQFLQQQMMQQQVMQHQLLSKQKQLEDLQKQLSLRSDTRSNFSRDSGSSKKKMSQPTMTMPSIPSSLRNKYPGNRGSGSIMTQPYDRDNISIDANVDNLINSGFDTQSHHSGRSNRSNRSNRSGRSKGSSGSKRSRKKPSIKINTN